MESALLDSLKVKGPRKSKSVDGNRRACHHICNDDVMPGADSLEWGRKGWKCETV